MKYILTSELKMASPATLMSDTASLLGPTYNYAEELPPPSSIGVKVGDTFDQVYDNIEGVNYYVDAIGFGEPTFLNGHSMQPLGLRYFLDTGFTCSNGAKRYEYVDTTPQGDSLGSLVKTELEKQGLPPLKGLAPGILEDAQIALNPLPLFSAALGDTGYSECVQIEKPVGDMNKRTISRGGERWMTPDVVRNGQPYQTRWIKSRSITQEQFNATPKTHNPDGSIRPAADVQVDAVRTSGGLSTLEPFAGAAAAAKRDNKIGRGMAGAVVLAAAALAMFFI